MVIWSEPAVSDLRSIHDYIATNSRFFYAVKVVQGIRENADVLDEFPAIGRVVPEIRDNNVRELSLYSYRIIYETRSGNVFVLAVVHKRMNLTAVDVERVDKLL